ncbi:hypothetical protein SLA2020_048220 [Shorea laevis]
MLAKDFLACNYYMGELGFHFEVYRNDELTVEELKRYTSRFGNIIANCCRAWTYCAFIWRGWIGVMAAQHKKYKHIQGVQFPSRKHHNF